MYVDLPVSADGGVFVPRPDVPLKVLLPSERMQWRSPSRPRMPLKVSLPSERMQQRRRSQSPGVAPNTVCTEETWQNRMVHRKAGVDAIKRTPEYMAATVHSYRGRGRQTRRT